MIGEILPSGVAWAEAFDDDLGADLFPEEAAEVARAVDGRQREYATVRRCARTALAELGCAPGPILPGPKNEPCWPDGIVGSMTHCAGYRAAALARSAQVAAIGIDAEPHRGLARGLLGVIARCEEMPVLDGLRSRFPEVHWDTLTFSAKESVYKAWYPLARRWLGFEDATVRFDPAGQSFVADLHKAGPVGAGRPLNRLAGRYLVAGGLVLTTVTVPG